MNASSDVIAYSVVIPVFKSADYIAASAQRVVAVMDSLLVPYEILLVDDHSPDGTWETLKALKATYPQVRIFRTSQNIGQTPTSMAGAMKAKGQRIITLDDDLQHPPEEIPKMIAALESNEVDIVFGDPENRHHAYKQHPALVALGRFLFHQVFMRPYRRLNFFTTFRVFHASLLSVHNGPWSHLFFIWQLDPTRAMHIATKHKGRKQGASNHTFGKLLRHFAPFLWYFALRAIWVLQMLLLLLVIAYIVHLYYATWIWMPPKNLIIVAALAVLLAKVLVATQLKRTEKQHYDIIEG